MPVKCKTNKSGHGKLEPTKDELMSEIARQGYVDWEYVSDEFFGESHNSDVMGEGEFVSWL